MTTVVGLDLSLTGTGIALLNINGRGMTCRLKSDPAGMDVRDRRERLRQLRDDILRYAGAPELAVIEQPAFSRTTGQQHDRSGLWWLVVDALLGRDVPVVEVVPQALKRYATSKAGAGKDEVLAAVVRRWRDVEVCTNDEADALVLARMGATYLEWFEPEFAYQRVAMEAVSWPEFCRR